MKIKEVSHIYNISMTTLRDYEKAGLFDNVTRIKGVREYGTKDIQRLSFILTLKNAGLQMETIFKYIQLTEQGNQTTYQRIQILKKERCQLLDKIHHCQKSIDSLDYLIYEFKDGKGESYGK